MLEKLQNYYIITQLMPAQNPEKEEQLIELNGQIIKLPTHVAIIVDGNGRWEKERGLTRMQGHDTVFVMLYAIIMNRRIVGKVTKRIICKR